MEFPLLKNSPLWDAFSDLGRSIFQPNGIFYWGGRAKKESEINGTIGAIVGPEDELLQNGNQKNITFYIPAIKEYLAENPEDLVPYAPVLGLPDMRKHWYNWIVEKGKNAENLPTGKKNVNERISLPTIVPGITFGIFMAARLFLTPGEIIVSPNKRWGNYDSVLSQNSGAKVISFEMFTNSEKPEFNVDGMLKKLEESLKTQNKAVLILNFPNNPTGYVPTKAEGSKIIESLKQFAGQYKKPIILFCDDAYEGYVYNEEGMTGSLFYELTGLHEYLIPIKMDGSSKEVLMYGARIAAFTLGLHEKWYPTGKKDEFLTEFDNKCEALVRSTVSNSNRFVQSIIVKMFEQGIGKIMESRNKIIDVMIKRYNLINKLLFEIHSDKVSVDPNSGGFFLLLNLEKSVRADDFNEHLLKKYKMGFIPIVKENEGINAIRIAYCSTPEPQIPKLVENLKNAFIDFNLI